jgi:hypothetical protein
VTVVDVILSEAQVETLTIQDQVDNVLATLSWDRSRGLDVKDLRQQQSAT